MFFRTNSAVHPQHGGQDHAAGGGETPAGPGEGVYTTIGYVGLNPSTDYGLRGQNRTRLLLRGPNQNRIDIRGQNHTRLLIKGSKSLQTTD